MRTKLFLFLAAALLILSPTLTSALTRSLGDSQVIAPVPLPGYPEGIATAAAASTFPAPPPLRSPSDRRSSLPTTSARALSKPPILLALPTHSRG